jgi:hypothetical protein
MRTARALLILTAAGLTTACGPTVISRHSLGYLDPGMGVEVRIVQPDWMDPNYQTRELWGFNSGDEPVCVGYKNAGSSWYSALIAPGTERKLLSIGSGYIEAPRGLVATMPNGEACTDAYVARMSEQAGRR